jgi:membrane fusion protein (multidrug efflux system)
LSKLNQIKFDIKQSIILAKQDGIIAKLNLEKGEYIDVGKILFAIVDEQKSWLEANIKETDLTNIKVGQSAFFIPDTYPNSSWKAEVESISPATGAEFSILPPQNSSGNWVKVVQRIPVKLSISGLDSKKREKPNINRELRVGMSVSVTIDTKHEGEVPFIIRPFSKIFKLF